MFDKIYMCSKIYVINSYISSAVNEKAKLGKHIKVLRESRNLSQNEVAIKLGLHRPAVSEIERGNRDVTAEEIIKLAEMFHVTLEGLMSRDSSNGSTLAKSADGSYKITFIRHGEAVDDIYDQYGGWADPELTTMGILKAHTVADSLKGQNFDIVFTSPLQRAKKMAEIISSELKLDLKIIQYLKERNSYGLLCGVNKEIAKSKYPELVEAHEKGDYVLGSERIDDFSARVNLVFEFIEREGLSNVICVTHSNVLKDIIGKHLDMKYDKLGDGCKLEVIMKDGLLKYVGSDGITFVQ
jgi:broad specificity phosphatase PhoE/plasmid maintenance system antidote protein VapI